MVSIADIYTVHLIYLVISGIQWNTICIQLKYCKLYMSVIILSLKCKVY